MSESNNPPAGTGLPPRIARVQGQQPSVQHAPPPNENPARRWNINRDISGAVLLVLALLFPWNLYFGMGIPNSSNTVLLVLTVVTLLSLGSIAVTYVGPARVNPVLAGRLRLILNAPYLALGFAFVAFDAVQTVRYGGSIKVPGGVGPGAWLGVAGSLLCAQPVLTRTPADDSAFARWLASARVVGYASIIGAVLSFVFVLYWRVRYAMSGAAGTSGFGKENAAVLATALVYGAVALAAVIVASSWIIRDGKHFRLATAALGASTLVAGIVVWLLPVGREIDGFHGIAQNTSTAGVGFEGYLAWAAVGAIFAPTALLQFVNTRLVDEGLWREAARKGLLLIVVWCAGSVLMRLTDLAVTVSLNYPYSRYDSMALVAFDLLTAAVAVWLRLNVVNHAVSARPIWSMCGVLFTLTIARIVVGIVLAPRFLEPKHPAGVNNAVYGNNLAQQITSTFDVVLCGLAFCILAVAVTANRRARRTGPSRRPARRVEAPLPADRPTIYRTAGDR